LDFHLLLTFVKTKKAQSSTVENKIIILHHKEERQNSFRTKTLHLTPPHLISMTSFDGRHRPHSIGEQRVNQVNSALKDN